MDQTLLGLALGAIVGFILALTGAGGGILAVPLLVFGLHLSLKQAAPVGLIAVGLSASVGAILGLKDRIVRYRAAVLIGSIGMIFAPLGVWLAQRLPNAPLTIGFSGILAFTAWRTHHSSAAPSDCASTGQPCVLNKISGRLNWNMSCAQTLAATGMISGLLSGLLGAGGGFVIVPALKRFTDIPVHSIMATSLSVITLVSLSGVVSASVSGKVQWNIAIPFGIGAIIALIMGRLFARKIHGMGLLKAFSVLCAAVSVLMFAKGCGWLSL